MNSIKLLKIMIDLFIYGSITMFLFLLYMTASFDHTLPYSILNLGLGTLHGHEYFSIAGASIDSFSLPNVILLLFALLRVLFFFIIIFHIKNLATNFINGELFSDITSRSLKVVGYGILLYVVTETVIENLPAFLDNRIEITMDGLTFTGLRSGWFQFTLGLLFIFMDKVFQNAKILKQENELTI